MFKPSLRARLIRYVLSAGGIFLLVASTGVLLEEFRVSEADGVVLVQWKSLEETALVRYEVRRRARNSMNNQFEVVARVTPHGPNKPYEFRDTQVYKSGSEEVTYRLEAVRTNGQHLDLGERSLSYSPTAVRRTWGSIKAMFQ
jgi:hypothetical protein